LRYLTPEILYGEATRPDFGVLDLSFISLTKVLQPLWELLIPPREVVLLVKPQFEVGRDRVGEKGVVRNPKDHYSGIMQVMTAAQHKGWCPRGLTWSPIRGPAGNIEYLLWLAVEARPTPTEALNDNGVEKITQSAYQQFHSRLQG